MSGYARRTTKRVAFKEHSLFPLFVSLGRVSMLKDSLSLYVPSVPCTIDKCKQTMEH